MISPLLPVSSTIPPEALVLDVRSSAAFCAGHIPGAVHWDLWGLSLVNTDPAPLDAFTWMIERLLAARGVTGDRPVIVCDADSGLRAARAFWFLEYFDHPDVRVRRSRGPAGAEMRL